MISAIGQYDLVLMALGKIQKISASNDECFVLILVRLSDQVRIDKLTIALVF